MRTSSSQTWWGDVCNPLCGEVWMHQGSGQVLPSCSFYPTHVVHGVYIYSCVMWHMAEIRQATTHEKSPPGVPSMGSGPRASTQEKYWLRMSPPRTTSWLFRCWVAWLTCRRGRAERAEEHTEGSREIGWRGFAHWRSAMDAATGRSRTTHANQTPQRA
jgi:hypothetical protein